MTGLLSQPGGMKAGMGGIMDVIGGFQENQAYDTQAGADQANARQAIQMAKLEMGQKAIQVQRAAGEQAEEYASGGVTGKGTPAQIIAQTRALGQQEINQIGQAGALKAQLLKTQANQATQAGRNSILGGIGKAALGLSAFI
jgi:hypothetical protein